MAALKQYKYMEKTILKSSLANGLERYGKEGWQVVNITDLNQKSDLGYATLTILFMKEIIIPPIVDKLKPSEFK